MYTDAHSVALPISPSDDTMRAHITNELFFFLLPSLACKREKEEKSAVCRPMLVIVVIYRKRERSVGAVSFISVTTRTA